MFGKDKEMASSGLVKPSESSARPADETRVSRAAGTLRILPIPIAALIGALVFLKVAEGWTVIPLGIIEVLLFLLILRLWLPEPKTH
jgi:hypothetical protein